MSRSWKTRAETGADLTTIRDINLAAFDTSQEADIVEALRRDDAWIDGLSQLAVTEDGTPVGHALLTRCHIGTIPALCLGPCAVLPAHQRGGAGAAAIRAALEQAGHRGERYVIVLGHAEYYPRFGWRRGAGSTSAPMRANRGARYFPLWSMVSSAGVAWTATGACCGRTSMPPRAPMRA